MGKADTAATRVVLHRLSGAKKALDLCRLVEALQLKGRRVAVWFADPGRAATLDDYLWTFAQQAFVPHALWDGLDQIEDPVAIVAGPLENPNGAEVLVLGERLADPASARAWSEVHDFLTSAPEDEGKAEAWQASGFAVQVVEGVAAAKPRR
ncbi:MAG TPA: DNA polymerase III subunit chi [Thermoanaerobaculaceae bacterium]|nr:DNA polymerase III subunit chi [Thermoanaerobaculaceae bacterium]